MVLAIVVLGDVTNDSQCGRPGRSDYNECPTDCAGITNRPLEKSRYRYTCISDCDGKRLLYVEDRKTGRGGSGEVGIGRVILVNKSQEITKDFIANEVFQIQKSSWFFGPPKYSETGAAMECRVNSARGVGHYGDRIHSSMKRGLSCNNGIIEIKESQKRIAGLKTFNFNTEPKQSAKQVCSIKRDGERDVQRKTEVWTKKKWHRQTRKSAPYNEYTAALSGFGQGQATCVSREQGLAEGVAQYILQRDAKACNFNPSGLPRHNDPDNTYFESRDVVEQKAEPAAPNVEAINPVGDGGQFFGSFE